MVPTTLTTLAIALVACKLVDGSKAAGPPLVEAVHSFTTVPIALG